MGIDIEEKFALVTGGAKRLGARLCRTLVEYGYNLIIHYHESETEAFALKNELDQINNTLKILCYHADLSIDNEIISLIKFIESSFGKLNVLINNASIFSKVSFNQINTKNIDQYLKIHITAPLLLSQLMINKNQSDEKIIINMLDNNRANNVENITDYGDYFLYSLTKHYQYLLNQYLVKEIKLRGLTCKIFGLLLSLILPNDLDREYFLKKNVSDNESQKKISKLIEVLKTILQDKNLTSKIFQI